MCKNGFTTTFPLVLFLQLERYNELLQELTTASIKIDGKSFRKEINNGTKKM